jgi:hypothetical protein
MSVLNRKLFNKGGKVSSRGVGITSGLDTPKRGLVDGPGSYSGVLEKYNENVELLKQTGLFPETKPVSKLQAFSPALIKLGAGLMSNRSLQGGFGGGLDILGQSVEGASPEIQEATQTLLEDKAKDPDEKLKETALTMALDDDAEKEKFTGKESFRARVPVLNEEGIETGTVVRTLTRFVSDQGNLQFRDQNNQTITNFEPFYKKETFEGPDGFQYEIGNDGKATVIEGQGAPIDGAKTFQGKDGFQYLLQQDPNDKTSFKAVLIPGQAEVVEEPFTFKGPDGYTYILNSSGSAEVIPGQGAPDKDIKTFKGTDGRTYILDEETRQAVLIPGQPEAEEDLEMFEGPNGIQYKVIDGEAIKIPGQEKQRADRPTTALFFNEKFKSPSNPTGIVSAQFEYDEARDKFRYTYEAEDGTIKNLPMTGSIEIGISGPFKDFESTVVKTQGLLAKKEINSRKAISAINSAIEFVQANPDSNTITSAVAAFTNEVRAEIVAGLRGLGKGSITSPEVLNPSTYQNTFEELGITDRVRQSKFLDLAYVVAAAREQTGKALSDKDLDRFIKIIGGDSASFPTVARTLENLKLTLATEYATEHNVYARDYEGIDTVANDYVLNPIGITDKDLVDPFNLNKTDYGAIIEEVEATK